MPTDLICYQESYASGKGQINIVGAQLGLLKNRIYRPISCTIHAALIPDKANPNTITGSESLLLRAYNWAIDGDIVRESIPRLVTPAGVTISIRWPYIVPTEFSTEDLNGRKLFSVFDFGINSGMGLYILYQFRIATGPSVTNQTKAFDLDALPAKRALVQSPPTSPFTQLDLASCSSSAPTSPVNGGE